MITASDKEYIQTKLIKQGKIFLNGPFLELAEWINQQKGVTVLNVIYGKVIPDDRPRLQVITETQEEQLKFRHGDFGNFIKSEQDQITQKFKEILKRDRIDKYETEQLFVVFSAFEPIAKEEANNAIPDKEIKKLKKQLNNSDLWKIERCFSNIVFFFYTESQVLKSSRTGLKKNYTDEYFKIIMKYDEFAYFQRNEFNITFDPKENFDTNYQGNWFYYWR